VPSVVKFASSNAVVTTGFTNPTNAYADDASYATAAPAKSTSITTDYGFASFTTGDIPAGSTIVSVTAELQYKSDVTTSTGAVIGLQLNNGGTLLGSETTFGMNTSDQTVTKQATTGITLADLQSAGTVKARVRAFRSTSNTAVTWSADYVKLTVVYNPVLTAAQGSYTDSGQAAILAVAHKLTAAQGAYTESGQAAALKRGRTLVAAQGAYTASGQSATLAVGHKLVAATGSLVETGQAAILARGLRVPAVTGAYADSGQAATLRRGFSLTAAQGSYTETGQAATLARTRVLAAAQGAYAESGQAAVLRVTHRLVAAQGGYALTGGAAGLASSHAGSTYALCHRSRCRTSLRRRGRR
jgi:hypothetical protein